MKKTILPKTIVIATGALLGLSTPQVFADSPIYGTIVLRSPVSANIQLTGTVNDRGEIQLRASNGVQAVGKIAFQNGIFVANMFNVAPPGKRFSDGSERRPFNVSGPIIDGIMAGDFSASDTGTFILCGQKTYETYRNACEGKEPLPLATSSPPRGSDRSIQHPPKVVVVQRKTPSGPPSKASIRFYDAIRTGNLDVAALALQDGADINCQNCGPGRDSPLMLAAQHKSEGNTTINPVLKFLIERGANINLQNKNGMTALAIAANKGNNEFYSNGNDVLYLLKNGADPRISDVNGNSPLHHYSKDQTLPPPLKAGGWSREYLQTANQTYETVTRELINRGASINAANESGNTALHQIAAACRPQALAYIISLGGNPQIKNSRGETARDLAFNAAAASFSQFCNETIQLLR